MEKIVALDCWSMEKNRRIGLLVNEKNSRIVLLVNGKQ